MQPTFLPWAGFFNLMSQVDDFVLLDDVQLEKQSWQTRNRLLIGGQVKWICVPVRHVSLSQTIAETQIADDARWRIKLARSVEQNYGKHAHYQDASEILELLVTNSSAGLSDLNEAVIRLVAKKLQIFPRLHRSSDLGVEGARSDRLANICRQLDAKEYLSPLGAALYLEEDGFAESGQVRLRFQDFPLSAYPQRTSPTFKSHLSIFDVVANLGWDESARYVRRSL